MAWPFSIPGYFDLFCGAGGFLDQRKTKKIQVVWSGI
jgi:hypothetical protein